MEGPRPRSLANLVRAVAILVLPPADKISWLDSLGIGRNVDELGLELGDGLPLVPQFAEKNWLSAEEVAAAAA
jgi:hypothetical protein